MLRIGLTGNIGSGKTIVSSVFSALGVPVYHADEESKKFLFHPEIRKQITRRFGVGILEQNGEIARRSLASVVFSDKDALKWLNSLLHPLVREDFRRWASGHAAQPYVIQEAAIIFESGFGDEFDFIIHVACPKEIAIGRVVKRDGTDGNSVMQRMRFQMDDAEKARRSDFVIRNDGTELVIPQVLAIHQHLSEIYPKHNQDVSSGDN